VARIGHEHYGRHRYGRDGFYDYGLDCPYYPYQSYTYPYNSCIY
jgi:hypothetical protein